MLYICDPHLWGQKQSYGMAIIQVVGLIYFIFLIIHTVQQGAGGGSWEGTGVHLSRSLNSRAPHFLSSGQFQAICAHTHICISKLF